MALPTIPNYWTTRKNIYEQAIVKRRNHEDDFRQKWSNTSSYFQKHDVEAAKQTSWSNQNFLDQCADSYKSSVEQDLKTLQLKTRRMKLADMLGKENKKYEAELKNFSKENYFRLEDMKERVDELKSAREEQRKQTASEKLYEHWRQNNPDIRKIESNMMQEHVINQWPQQLEEQREKMESARREREEYERMMEEDRQAALAEERRKARERIAEEKNLKNILREQMMELKEREQEAELFRQQQEELERNQLEVELIEEERKQREKERHKQEFGRILLRQHKAQMLRKSRQIQEELEQDKRLLESLIHKEKEELALQTARREEARADAAWMKEVIEDQLRVEKAREAELDMLYQDEAARMWQKREGEWEREKRARERLMQEVLEERQEQIVDKMEKLRLQQEESLERREQLLQEIDIANQLTRREREEEEADRMQFRQNLQEQITSRRDREKSAHQQLQQELDEEKRAERDYDELLRQETERMRQLKYSPRGHGRKQAWM